MPDDPFLDLPRQGPGSEDTTRHLLTLADRGRRCRRVLDLGCGTGASALSLARLTGAEVVAVDRHQPYLDRLRSRAGDADIAVVNASMDALPFPDGSFDLVWCEGAVYCIGFDAALSGWRRLLAAEATLVVTEIELATDHPSDAVVTFWADRYPLRSETTNRRAARSAGFEIVARYPLPDRDWWDEYYALLAGGDNDIRAEIALRREHGTEYHYVGYVLRRD